ncbi:MAG: nucleoside deaminase [Bacilli bacterium]|nr:nucleoside deaminase [Bacilli bacterium]
MNNDYMKEAYQLAQKAFKKKEVPIGAIVVNNNKIIGKGYNSVERNKDCTKHAEIIAIQQAQKKLKNWRLNNCTLYVTLHPCLMCIGAIIQSRISHVVYAVESNYLTDSEKEYIDLLLKTHNVDIQKGSMGEENKKILGTFFKKKRIQSS